MASLTASNVSIIKAWTEGSVTGKRRKVRQVQVAGVTVGGTSNTMPAAAFGLQVIEEATVCIYGTTAYALVPASDGSVVYAFASLGGASAAADVAIGASPNGMYFTVKGY
jgi:hypothetical protein